VTTSRFPKCPFQSSNTSIRSAKPPGRGPLHFSQHHQKDRQVRTACFPAQPREGGVAHFGSPARASGRRTTGHLRRPRPQHQHLQGGGWSAAVTTIRCHWLVLALSTTSFHDSVCVCAGEGSEGEPGIPGGEDKRKGGRVAFRDEGCGEKGGASGGASGGLRSSEHDDSGTKG
jgi:hypothetical protein